MFTVLRTILSLLGTYTMSPGASLRRDDGQTMAEYAVVLAVIAIGIFVALTALSGGIAGALDQVTADL